MDVLVELTGTYLQRVTGVTVLKPAAGNWEVQLPEATKYPIRGTAFDRNNSSKPHSGKHN